MVSQVFRNKNDMSQKQTISPARLAGLTLTSLTLTRLPVTRLAKSRRGPAAFSFITLCVALLFGLFLLPACSIDANDNSKDGEKHVDIKSPMGDLHVSQEADIRDAGLTLYPGAKPAPKSDSDDKKSANVNLSLPGFALKVVAAEFVSDDAPDKILAYYNKELPKYGKTIQCHGGWENGHANFDDKDEMSKPVSCGKDGGGDAVELKVGTEGNQHIVSVKPNVMPNGKGSRFALVYIRMHTGSDTTI